MAVDLQNKTAQRWLHLHFGPEQSRKCVDFGPGSGSGNFGLAQIEHLSLAFCADSGLQNGRIVMFYEANERKRTSEHVDKQDIDIPYGVHGENRG